MADPQNDVPVQTHTDNEIAGNPNQNRGPYCLLCGTEMNHPNHRFQGRIDLEHGGLSLRRYRGVLFSGYEPLCGEGCLARYVTQWATMKQEPITATG